MTVWYCWSRLGVWTLLALILTCGQESTGSSMATPRPIFTPVVSAFNAATARFSINTHPLVAATYFGGAGQDQGWPSTPAAFDADGNIVFAVLTSASGLATAGSYQTGYGGSGDVLVVKMNPQLTSVMAATYLGGTGAESAFSLAVGDGGHIYIGGLTSSTNFPTTPGAYDVTRTAEEGFVAEFSANLDSLLASTFIGGSANDRIDDIAVSSEGSVYAVIQTASTNLTVTPGAIDNAYSGGASDYFLVRLDSGLTTALAATYLGGNSDEYRARLHTDANNDIYVTGCTFSTNWPITPGAFDAVNGGGSMDAIILHLNKELTTILASTYIGGNYTDWIYCVDVAANGDLYLSGHASGGWPVTPGCFDSMYGGPIDGEDSYVARISGDLTTLEGSTFLGGSHWDWGVDILVDSNGFVYVVGETYSPDFPVTADAYHDTKSDTTDMFLSIFDSTMSRLHMSTFVGGSGLDRWPGLLRDENGNLYILGYTESGDMTTTGGAAGPAYGGAGDIYIAGFDFDPFTRITDIAPVMEAKCSFGAYWGDYDRDDYPDLFVTRWWPSGDHPNALYHNNGDGTFTDAGQLPSQDGFTLGATWGDYDNDGFLDLFAARPKLGAPGSGNLLYHNSGDGTFTKITTSPAAQDAGFAVHTTFEDFDLDGDLDLLIGNHNTPGGLSYYRNDGGGGFVRQTNDDIGLDTDDCGAISVAGYDGDGDADLVHARNMLTSLCFGNDGNGTFTPISNAVTTDSTRAYCWGDYDNDGDFDLCGGDEWAQGLVLYRNDGGVLTRSVVDSNDTTTTVMRNPSWVDFDNDGDLDLFVAKQGAAYAPVHSAFYINAGDETLFPMAMSVIVTDSGPSTGAAWADYDRDGDLDIFIANTNSSASALYRNDAGNANHWISIACVGTQSNRSSIGAKIRVVANIGGTEVRQLREIFGQSAFFGQDEMRAHFGLGDAATVDSIIIEWPSGMIDVLTDVAPNQFMTITESLCGDANGDEKINVGDAVYIITYVFRGGPAPQPPVAGDANCDTKTNVGDGVYLISYIFRGGPAPCCPQVKPL